MLKKWLLKNGIGSVGKSVKVLAKDYVLFSKDIKNNTNVLTFERMYNHRRMLNQKFPTTGDIIQILPFETFNHDKNDDLVLYILKILYHESIKFRNNLHSINSKSLNLVLEVIYETVYKNHLCLQSTAGTKLDKRL